MTDPYDYLSDFELTTILRPTTLADGADWQEPMWCQGDDEQGLAIFVSALDELLPRFRIGFHGTDRLRGAQNSG